VGESLFVSLVAKSKLSFSQNIFFATVQLDFEPFFRLASPVVSFFEHSRSKDYVGAIGLFYFTSCIFVIKREEKPL